MIPPQLPAWAATVLGTVLALTAPPQRDERGLSQSAETAILVAGAVAIALTVVAVIKSFVTSKLPK